MPTSGVVEQRVISAQLGRPLRAASTPVVRCHLGLPVVVEVPPILDDGTPFPTRFWLTCPLAVRRIARIESRGDIKQIDERATTEPEFGARLKAAHERYEREREALIPPDAVHRPTGGVAGASAGVKCLHAHYADFAAGRSSGSGENPVGELVAPAIEPLDCTVPCVTGEERNPEWFEP
ncbi:MAG: DUF501 domain-containing protein [Acidimicrobiia bacterium]